MRGSDPRSERSGRRVGRGLAVVAIGLLAACEGVTIEIVQPASGDGGIGAPGVVLWELRSTPFDGDGCPSPAELAPSGAPSWISPTDASGGADEVVLTPDRRQVVSAVGRDERCGALFYGRACIGPEAPPRVVSLVTCPIGDAACLDLRWTPADRAALSCTGVCTAGRCE
ncbi:MAG: hypothetical protein AB7S26_32070 [Sandaracinaceae bacterium]